MTRRYLTFMITIDLIRLKNLLFQKKLILFAIKRKHLLFFFHYKPIYVIFFNTCVFMRKEIVSPFQTSVMGLCG